MDAETIPTYMKISEKALHLRRLGMKYSSICDRLGIDRWMAMKAVRWASIEDGNRKKPNKR